MARIQGVQKADAGLKIKLVYRLGPRMMKKLTGREPQTGSGIEPMEIWAYQPKMMFAMGKFNQAVVEITALLTVVNIDRFNAAFGIGSAGFSDGMVCVPPDRPAASPALATIA